MKQYYFLVYHLACILGLNASISLAAQAQPINCYGSYRLNVTQVTATSASLYYSEASSSNPYSITYAPLGSAPSAAITATGTTSPIILPGLTPHTTYQVSFSITCGTSGQTSPVESLSFRTDCNAGTTYPYSENFDGVLAKATPCGYTVLNVNSDGYGWTNYPISPASAPNAMRYTYSPTKAADDWFFTRGLQMQAGMAYQLQFKYRGHSSSYSEGLEVKAGLAANAASQTTVLFTNTNITNVPYITTMAGSGAGQVLSFVPTTSGVYYLGFHAISAANMFYVFVDDIQVTASAVLATKSSVASGFRAEASPVPFGEQLTLSLNTLQTGPLQLTLLDVVGRVVRQHRTTVPAGASALTVPDAGTLPAGVYLLTVRQGGNTQVIRVAHE